MVMIMKLVVVAEICAVIMVHIHLITIILMVHMVVVSLNCFLLHISTAGSTNTVAAIIYLVAEFISPKKSTLSVS